MGTALGEVDRVVSSLTGAAQAAREGVSGGAVGGMAGASTEHVSVTAVPLHAQLVEKETIAKEKPVGQAVPVKKD